jgi:uncharacterized protein (DUF2236 family)
MCITMSVLPSEDEARRLLVGPGSVTWQRASDVRLYPISLYPLLLQVAHPVVGAGVRDFSDFDRRPWNRLVRTLDYVQLIVYGGEEAIAVGRRLREVHKGFRGVREDGRPYNALEPEAYAWVHATLIESYVAGHQHFGTPMSPAERETFYREYRGLGRLLGVRERDLPDSWDGFSDYFDAKLGELVPTASVARVLGTVGNAPMPFPMPRAIWRALRIPAARLLWLGGIGPMAPALRERLGIRFTRSDERAFRALARASRATDPVLPQALRITGPPQLRARRRAIARGPLGSDGAAERERMHARAAVAA